ncbi:MAG: cyclase family protein [Acidobacteria bacterium]|nr:cyclase family protein [Acidobacteriota bacterium]
MKIIDITRELFSCEVFPGDMRPVFERVRQMPGDPYNLTNISFCAHNGTHIDAPRHFIADGAAIDELSLEVFYGRCAIVELRGRIDGSAVAPFLGNERLLLKGNGEMTAEAAEAVTSSAVRLLGVENQSVGTDKVHVILLGGGVALLEGLNLEGVEPGEYILAAFPLKLAGCEGAPVRAVLLGNAER